MPRKSRIDLKIKTTELQIARVKLATQVVLLIGAIVGVMALLERSQVGRDGQRAVDAHAAAEKGVVVLVADQASDERLALVGGIFFQPRTCSWSMQRRPLAGSLRQTAHTLPCRSA